MNERRNVLIALALAVALTVLLAAACIIALPEGPTPVTTRQPLDLPPWPVGTRGDVGILYANCPGCGDNTDFSATFKVWDPQDMERGQAAAPYCDPLISGDPIGIACNYQQSSTSFYGGTWQLSHVLEVIPDANWSVTALQTYIYMDSDTPATEAVTVTIRSGPTFVTSTLEATSVITSGNIIDNTGDVVLFQFGEWSPRVTIPFAPAVSMTSGGTYWVVFSTDDENGYLLATVNGASKNIGGCEGNEAINCGDDYAAIPVWYEDVHEWVVKPTTTPTQFYSILAQDLAIPLAFDSGSSATNTPTVTPTPNATQTAAAAATQTAAAATQTAAAATQTAAAATQTANANATLTMVAIPPLFTATPTPTHTTVVTTTNTPNATETVIELNTATPTTTATATPIPAIETPTLLPTSTPSYYFIEILSSQASPAVDWNLRGSAGVDDEFVELRVLPAQTLTGWSMELGGCTYTFATDNYSGPIKVIWADQFRSGANVCPGFDHPGMAILRDQNGIIQDIRLYWTYGNGNSWRALYWTDPGGAWIPASPSPGIP